MWMYETKRKIKTTVDCFGTIDALKYRFALELKKKYWTIKRKNLEV